VDMWRSHAVITTTSLTEETGPFYLLPANRSLFPNPGDIHE
jgi:hypothetical protein